MRQFTLFCSAVYTNASFTARRAMRRAMRVVTMAWTVAWSRTSLKLQLAYRPPPPLPTPSRHSYRQQEADSRHQKVDGGGGGGGCVSAAGPTYPGDGGFDAARAAADLGGLRSEPGCLRQHPQAQDLDSLRHRRVGHPRDHPAWLWARGRRPCHIAACGWPLVEHAH